MQLLVTSGDRLLLTEETTMTNKIRSLVFAVCALYASTSFADPGIPAATQIAFSRPHQLVDIGGRRLNLYCSGAGPTTVVFDAPSGDAGWSWWSVQPEVAKRTRACVYDRAGLGFSDPATRPGTSGNAVDDLHKLLAAAGVLPPYVMVGNSYGGANVQLYAYRYPAEVTGLVLVEAQHEDETQRLDAVTGGKLTQMYAMQNEMEKMCVAEAEKGFTPGSQMLLDCTGGVPPMFGRELAAAQFASAISPTYWHAASSENSHFDIGKAELRAARRPLGDLPLVVLTRGVSPYAIPGQPQSALNKATEAENEKIHKEMAALSTRGIHRVVPGAGHLVQADKPEAVVNAVDEVLAQLGR
jgi:pimeloyl-ACP methyl ester carboxylesterase